LIYKLKYNKMENKEEVKEFVPLLHQKYLEALDKTKDVDSIGFFTNEHLKLPGGYWCVGALSILDKVYVDRKPEIIKFI